MRVQLEQYQQPQRPEIDFLEGISIISMDANQETEALSTLLLDKTGYFYYKISNLKLSYFLDPSFMEKVALKKGNDLDGKRQVTVRASCLHARRLDVHDSFSLVNQTLILNLTSDSYYSLGLNGVKCANFATINRYLVTIDLANPSFRPGQKFYDRVLWCFTSATCPLVTEGLSVLIAAAELDHQGVFVCSLPLDFPPAFLDVENEKSKSLVERIVPSIADVNALSNVWSPDFSLLTSPQSQTSPAINKDGGTISTKIKSANLMQLSLDALEWIGLVLINSPRLFVHDNVDPFISSYVVPSSLTENCPKVTRTSLEKGFYIPEYLRFIISQSRQVHAGQGQHPFTVFARGFPHSPLIWGRENSAALSSKSTTAALAEIHGLEGDKVLRIEI